MNDLRRIFLGLLATFALPWLIIVVGPTLSYQGGLAPVPYNRMAVEAGGDGRGGQYPASIAHSTGALLYAKEGCVQCHSQMVRAGGVGIDTWRQGWGADQGERPGPTRQTRPHDYLWENYAYLGIARHGPDLANVGYRLGERQSVHMRLYSPRSLHRWSNMPSYKHLYRRQAVQGEVPANAVDIVTVRGDDGEDFQWAYVPTEEAELLVDYLYSLKRAEPVPVALMEQLGESRTQGD
jgi:cytochrome c oxidase cbb3-type subunit II